MTILDSLSTPLLTVEQRRFGDCLTVSLAGELDVATGGMVVEAVDASTVDEVSLVLLDLSLLTFIDCTGVDALMALRLRVQAGGGMLVARDATDLVAMVLRATGADRILQSDGCECARQRPAIGASRP